MKVKLKDIKPNPYRYINKGYPIDKAKVEKLRSSIARTGFWDNLVARQKDGEIEIAYGHHRIEACRQELGDKFEIDVIVKDLDDATMLKIMAAENDSMDIMSPMVINETVRATLDFLKDVNSDVYAKEARKHGISTKAEGVAQFLNWSPRRIQEAMKAIHSIEKGLVDKEEYESIPFQAGAEEFRRQVTLNPIPKEKRTPIIEKLKTGELGHRHIRKEVLKAKFPTGNGNKDIMLEDIAGSVSKKMRDCGVSMTDNFIKNSEHLSEESIKELSESANFLFRRLKKLKENLSTKQQKLLEIK